MDAEYSCIPDYTLEALRAYIEEGILPGGFLKAVLENDFFGAIGKADENNYAALRKIAEWVWWKAPAGCWGSPAKVKTWIERSTHIKLSVVV